MERPTLRYQTVTAMNRQNSVNLQLFCVIGLFIVIHILTYNPFFSLKIYNAVPILTIAAVVTVAFYFGEWWGFISGIISGTFSDAVGSGAICLDAVFLMCLGLVSGILLRKYLNRNILSVGMLSFTGAILYFLLNGLIFTFKNDAFQGLEYLLLHCLPSAIYSGLFIFPFFYIFKLIKKI